MKTGENFSLTIADVIREHKEIYQLLTEEEKAVALLDAIKKKAAQMEIERIERERNERREALMRIWTYDECYQFALQRGKDIGEQRGFEFELDQDNTEVFKMLCEYFSNDPRFEQRDYHGKHYSLRKGICLLSPVRGNGKTTLLDCFMYNRRGCFGKRSTKQMYKEALHNGPASVEKYMWLVPVSGGANHFYQDKAGFHYDDFGDESELVHMGNRMMISSMIINSIYDEHRDENLFWRFHISMNYKWSEYEKKYGTNSASRMQEMFNLIPVPGESRRGK